MEDFILYNLKLAKLSNELDVAKHLTLSDELSFQLLFAWIVTMLEGNISPRSETQKGNMNKKNE